MRSSCSIRALPACSSSTQYAQSGLKGQIPLYTAFTIDEIVAAAAEGIALGVPGAQQWVNDLPNDAEQEVRRRLSRPSTPGLSPTFYGAQTYDAAA